MTAPTAIGGDHPGAQDGDGCTYVVDAGDEHQHVCERRPLVADYIEWDPVQGERRVAGLCARHDSAPAQAYALAHGIERRPRQERAAGELVQIRRATDGPDDIA